MSRITLKFGTSIEEAFKDFMLSRKSKGLAGKTIISYQNQFRTISKHIDISLDITTLQKRKNKN